jgi:hypothetical protein
MNHDETVPATLPSAQLGPSQGKGNVAGDATSGRLRFSKTQLVWAFLIAAISDGICAVFALAPPVVWAVDGVTAALLFGVLGWQWLLLPGLIMEAIPCLAVLPLWLLVVFGIAVWGKPRPKLKTDGLSGSQSA